MLDCFRSDIFHFLFEFRQGCPFDFSSLYHHAMYSMPCSTLMEYVRLSWKYKEEKSASEMCRFENKVCMYEDAIEMVAGQWQLA